MVAFLIFTSITALQGKWPAFWLAVALIAADWALRRRHAIDVWRSGRALTKREQERMVREIVREMSPGN